MIKTEWKSSMKFISRTESGHDVIMDSSKESGGNDEGVRPKELLLVALSGCTGMDVVSILKKMKVEEYSFRTEVEYHSTSEHPKIYDKIKINYIFRFEGAVPEEKVRKAVELSQEKYCGVSSMLKKASELSYEVIYE